MTCRAVKMWKAMVRDVWFGLLETVTFVFILCMWLGMFPSGSFEDDVGIGHMIARLWNDNEETDPEDEFGCLRIWREPEED